MTFSARQVLTAAALNDLSITTLTTSGDVTVGGTLNATVTSTGDITAQDDGIDGGIVLGQAYSTAYVGIRTANMSPTASDEYVLLTDGNSSFVSAGTGFPLYLRAGGNDSACQIRLEPTNNDIGISGSVGIGTNTPGAYLHVTHPTSDTNARISSGDAGAYIGFDDSNTTYDWWRQRIGAQGNDIVLQTNGSTRMRVEANGNVDIDSNLIVGGNANVNSLTVLNGATVNLDLICNSTVSASRLQVGGHYIDDVAGTGNPYGSINVGGAMTWDGYAIDQQVVFMSNGSNFGIYNDVNNQWQIYCTFNGSTELRHAGTTRIATDSTYGSIIYGPGGYTQIGSANSGYSHFQTDRPAYYFNKRITVDEGVVSSYNEDLVLQRAGNNGIRLASAVAYHYYESKFQYESTSNDWSAQPVQEISQYDIGYATRSLNSDTHTGQLRAASGIWYLRNHNDGSYWTCAAVISNQSSYRMKQDIETWGYSKPLSSAVNATYDTTATDLVRQLRPVSYRFNKQDRLPRDLPEERRQEALDRLNRIRMSKGLKQFDSEEAIHECGRDCEHSVDDPCPMYRQWERGTIGFIAEEVGDVIPEATDMDVRPRSLTQGENTAIDGLALTAILTKALQEMDARITELEMTA